MKVKSESEVTQSLATPWTAAYQARPSMGFARQEYWSGVPSPSPIDPILEHKINLKTCKRIEIISNIFSGHNGMKLGINHRKRNEKEAQLHRS